MQSSASNIIFLSPISSPSVRNGHGILVHPLGINYCIGSDNSDWTYFIFANLCPGFIRAITHLDIFIYFINSLCPYSVPNKNDYSLP
jgi:hypothetical protein